MKLFSPIQSPSQLFFLSHSLCVYVCVNCSYVSSSPTYLLFQSFSFLDFKIWFRAAFVSGPYELLIWPYNSSSWVLGLKKTKKDRQWHRRHFRRETRQREKQPSRLRGPAPSLAHLEGSKGKEGETSAALSAAMSCWACWLQMCRDQLAAIEVRGGIEQPDPHWRRRLWIPH